MFVSVSSNHLVRDGFPRHKSCVKWQFFCTAGKNYEKQICRPIKLMKQEFLWSARAEPLGNYYVIDYNSCETIIAA